MKKYKKVTVTFLFGEEKGKNNQYYKDKAFDEIYGGYDVLNNSDFNVEDITK